MDQIKLQLIYHRCARLVGIFCLFACGKVGPDFLAEPAKPLPIVRLASDDESKLSERVKDSYLVMFRTEGYKSNLYFSSFAEEYAHHYGILNVNFESDPRIKNIDILTSIDMTGLKAPDWEPDFSGPKAIAGLFSAVDDSDQAAGVLSRVDFADEDSAEEALREWELGGKIWFAEPNEISRLQADGFDQWSKDYETKQEWHRLIEAPAAFASLAKTGEGALPGALPAAEMDRDPPVIAVMDSGVDYDHSQLKENIWVNSAVGAAGCTNDVHGCNTTKPSKGSLGNGDVWPVLAEGPGKPCDEANSELDSRKCDHGTHVAGIIAAKPSSDSKVAGVCPFCKIMILKVADVENGSTSGDPQISDDSQVRAFKYMARFRKSGGSAVRILNASIGKYSRSRSLAILVDLLKKVGSGTIVVAAASNEDSMIRAYPAALSNAIAVASVGSRSSPSDVKKSRFSNYGSWVDIAAPGNMNSTVSGDKTRDMSGTSMATPVVAGSAGLLLAAYPNLDFNQLRERILKTASASKLYGIDTPGGQINNQYYYPKISGEDARRPLLGGGVVDVNAMLLNKTSSATGQPLDRVSPGCGVIAQPPASSMNPWAVFILIMPLMIIFVRRVL